MRHRLTRFSRDVASLTKVSFGNNVVRNAGKRTGPERFTILPIGDLGARGENQSYENDTGDTGQHKTAVTPASTEVNRSPREQQIQTDLWKVSITVGACLISHLQNP